MFELDHLVHFVDKPEKLIEVTKEMGLHTVMGGKHTNWGTYNSLCYFGLSYIEFIGIYDDELFELAAKEPYTLHETYKKRQNRNGIARIALRTTSIEEDAKRLQQLDYEVFGPTEFSRIRPDGSVLKWQLLHFGKSSTVIDFPFLIQWEEEDEKRSIDLVEKGAIVNHAAGNIRIKEILIEVQHLSFLQQWAELFHYKIKKEPTQMKLYGPNCLFTFIQSKEGNNEIKQVTFTGAIENKELIVEGTTYVFMNE